MLRHVEHLQILKFGLCMLTMKNPVIQQSFKYSVDFRWYMTCTVSVTMKRVFMLHYTDSTYTEC